MPTRARSALRSSLFALRSSRVESSRARPKRIARRGLEIVLAAELDSNAERRTQLAECAPSKASESQSDGFGGPTTGEHAVCVSVRALARQSDASSVRRLFRPFRPATGDARCEFAARSVDQSISRSLEPLFAPTAARASAKSARPADRQLDQHSSPPVKLCKLCNLCNLCNLCKHLQHLQHGRNGSRGSLRSALGAVLRSASSVELDRTASFASGARIRVDAFCLPNRAAVCLAGSRCEPRSFPAANQSINEWR